jgi:aryl-alcohol dehydrogenase-like predicted oxidoreductase
LIRNLELRGKLRRSQALPAVSRLPRTAQIALETGKTVPQIALNWLAGRPSVSSIIFGARNEDQLRENLGAVGWQLTGDQIARLDAVSQVTPIYPYWHQRLEYADRNPIPV